MSANRTWELEFTESIRRRVVFSSQMEYEDLLATINTDRHELLERLEEGAAEIDGAILLDSLLLAETTNEEAEFDTDEVCLTDCPGCGEPLVAAQRSMHDSIAGYECLACGHYFEEDF